MKKNYFSIVIVIEFWKMVFKFANFLSIALPCTKNTFQNPNFLLAKKVIG